MTESYKIVKLLTILNLIALLMISFSALKHFSRGMKCSGIKTKISKESK